MTKPPIKIAIATPPATKSNTLVLSTYLHLIILVNIHQMLAQKSEFLPT